MIENSILISINLGVVQILKQTIPERFKSITPILSLVVGITISMLVNQDLDLNMRIFRGVICGLTATGAYSGGQCIKKGVTKKE